MKFKLDYNEGYKGIFIMNSETDLFCLNRHSPRPGTWDKEYTLTKYFNDIKVIGVDDI